MAADLNIMPGSKILVSRTDRIGDLLMAVPLAESIKLRYPDCEVHVMASLYASPVLENNSRIDGIVRVQHDQLVMNGRYRIELQSKVQRAGYQVAVVLYPEPHVCRLLYRVGVPHRIGTSRRFHSLYFNHHIHHSRKSNRQHEAEYNLDFLKFFVDGPTVATPRVNITEREQKHADDILKGRGVVGDFVLIHPGSGGSADSWPLEHYQKLVDEIQQKGIPVVISGSMSETPIIERMVSAMRIRPTTIAGDTDLRTLTAVLARARLVVSNSTGPLHLAAAVGTRVVGLYPSKRVMSPVRWGPLGEGHRVLQPSVAVCRCPQKKCNCMRSLAVATVADAVWAVLEQAPAASGRSL
ncbi:MAG: glycosyltransferase family 9 protein [candidate division Zixibacteria bacterium]|nr:glycosyltransferase family 9 protein [candidate division Zixibacteria bacterium]